MHLDLKCEIPSTILNSIKNFEYKDYVGMYKKLINKY